MRTIVTDRSVQRRRRDRAGTLTLALLTFVAAAIVADRLSRRRRPPPRATTARA